MEKYDFFEGLQRLSTRNMHITIENYLSNLKHTAKSKKNGNDILLGATRMAYMLGLIDKDTALRYHYDAIYKKVEYELYPFDNYMEKYDKIHPLSIQETKTLSATKAKEMVETYIFSLLDVMGKINTDENLYFVIEGVTGFAGFLKLFDYKEISNHLAKAYVKNGTNFNHY
jgi:hypothetical protein